MKHPRGTGFSLIELVIIIVVVSIAAVGMLALFGVVGRSLAINEDTQIAAQVAQECAEHIMAVRRNPLQGYAAITTTICDTPPLPAPPAGFTRTVAVTPLATNPPCTVAAAGTCQQVQVTVTTPTTAPAVLTLMVVNY